MTQGIIIVDERELIEAADAAAATLLYSTSGKLLNRGWAVVLNPQDRDEREELAAGMRLSRNSGRRVKGQCTIRARGQARRFVAWTIMPLENREPAFRIAILLATQATTDSEASSGTDEQINYRDAFEHAIEGIFRTTLDGRYLQANPALAKLYGFNSPPELIAALSDLNTQLYVQPGRRREFIELMNTEKFVSGFESEVRRADGNTIWIAEFARSVFDEAGNLSFYEGSVVDITGHQRAEAALRRSEEKFRLLVENLNLVPWEADIDSGKFTYVGKQAVELFGFPIETWFTDTLWIDHVHPEDRSWAVTLREEALSKKGRFEGEYRMLRADGSIVWVREMMGIIASSGGQEILGGFFLDVTFRRFTERSLEESQHFFEKVASATQVILFVYDLPEQECIYINGRVSEILGFSKEALTDMRPLFVLALAHPDEIAEHNQHFANILASQTISGTEREFRLRKADGDWVWMRSSEAVFKDKGAQGLQVLATFQDVTVRRLAMEELTNSEILFRSLAETTKVLPFEVNVSSDRFVFVGLQAESLFGYEVRKWYAEGFWDTIIHPEDLPRVAWKRIWEDAQQFESEAGFQAEFRLRKPEGEYVWVREVVRFNPAGPLRGTVTGFLFDVSEAKAREEEVNRSRRQLRELATRIEDIREEERIRIARELHDELGQALTLFRIDLDWLGQRWTAKGEAADQEAARKISVLKREAELTMERLRRLLSSLRPPILDELGLGAAIEWGAKDFSRRVGIRCQTKIEPDIDVDKAVATAVFRIFQEILTNIAKHAGASLVKTEMAMEDDAFTLVVSDNGRGFLPETTGSKKSFGLLGMRERVEVLGGTVLVSSGSGRGTTVKVRIPTKPAQDGSVDGKD